MNPLPLSFYRRQNVQKIAQELLGKHLFSFQEGLLTGGVIVETEAYCGVCDRAAHGFPSKRTPRTEVLFSPGGMAYIYLCYGVHHLLNIVTNQKDIPQGVLIRSIEPKYGISVMKKRRGKEELSMKNKKNDYSLTSGPGCVTQALAITLLHKGIALNSSQIWIEEREGSLPSNQIQSGPRIGVAYAQEDALLPWRFWISHSPWVSRGSPS